MWGSGGEGHSKDGTTAWEGQTVWHLVPLPPASLSEENGIKKS